MAESVVQGDYFFNGNLRAVSMTAPNNSVGNAQVLAGANLAADKLEHRYQWELAQPNTTATTETRVVGRCYGATGSVRGFHAGSIVANLTTATVTVDLQKSTGGGAFASILTAAITLNNATTARTAVAGTLASTTLVQGDLLQIVITATAAGGTLATGVFAFVTVDSLPV